MRRIIIIQNHVVSGLITVIGLITGFYGNGLKAVLFAVMGFILLDLGLREIERYYLRTWDEKGSHEENKGDSVSPIAWFKMRFCDIEQTDRDTKNDSAPIRTNARNHSARQIDIDRRRNEHQTAGYRLYDHREGC